MKLGLSKKYQPQFNFKSLKQAKEYIGFQKSVNPATYRWLRSKIVVVSGKRTPVKTIVKKLKGGKY